ncbi:MAG: hypothetical protein EBQ86_03765, partial [Betaproteobacteria bacterium]|nr:hypothetical protein [Betaproteobacteria bacterium]
MCNPTGGCLHRDAGQRNSLPCTTRKLCASQCADCGNYEPAGGLNAIAGLGSEADHHCGIAGQQRRCIARSTCAGRKMGLSCTAHLQVARRS